MVLIVVLEEIFMRLGLVSGPVKRFRTMMLVRVSVVLVSSVRVTWGSWTRYNIVSLAGLGVILASVFYRLGSVTLQVLTATDVAIVTMSSVVRVGTVYCVWVRCWAAAGVILRIVAAATVLC